MQNGTDRRVEVPFRVVPRLDQKPWGGTRLSRYGYALTNADENTEPLGEALLTSSEAVIADGPLVGQTLGALMHEYPLALGGELGLAITGNRPLFPLLIKLIDAHENLSIQVHPDDRQARPLGSLGKTEAWYVLEAEPGSSLYLGLQDPRHNEAFMQDCAAGDGRAASYLNTIPAIPHQAFIIPAGTVHALGAGVMVYEVQQPSELTFRLDDWGRVGADGQPRPRHLAEGRAALKPELQPRPLEPLALSRDAGQLCIVAACQYFAVERIALSSGDAIAMSGNRSAHVLTVIRGEATLATDAGRTRLGLAQTGVLPAIAAPGHLTATVPTVVLHGWVPDLGEDVIAPLRRAGATDDQIAALSGPLPDLAQALASPG
jgi:mannose-6-phosphate isomerase